MSLTELIEDIWCTDNNNLKIQTTLDNCVENLKIIKDIDPDFSRFPVFKNFKIIADFLEDNYIWDHWWTTKVFRLILRK